MANKKWGKFSQSGGLKEVILRYCIDDQQGITAFHVACRKVQLDEVEALLEAGVDVNQPTRLGLYPMHQVCKVGIKHSSFDVLNRLLMAGADINVVDVERRSALHIAASESSKEIVEYLLLHGMNPNQKDIVGQTPLHTVMFTANKNYPIVELLIRFKADPNIIDRMGRTPLHYAAYGLSDVEVLQCLLESGGQPDAQDFMGRTALNIAISDVIIDEQEDLAEKTVTYLIENSTSINTQDVDGCTPLHVAAKNDNIKIVELLISNFADVNLQDRFGATPLHLLSTHCDDPSIVKSIVGKMLDVRVVDKHEHHALHWAIRGGNDAMAELSMECGFNIDINDRFRHLPLIEALLLSCPDSAHPFSLDQYISEDDELLKSRDIFHQQTLKISQENVDISELRLHPEPVKLLEVICNRQGIGVLPDWKEVQNVKECIRQMAEIVAQEVSKRDARFECTVIPSGSVNEGTKCGLPDEFDFMFCLEKVSSLFNPIEPPNTAGFVTLQPKPSVTESELRPYQEFIDPFTGMLDLEKIYIPFSYIIYEIISQKDIWLQRNLPFIFSCVHHFRQLYPAMAIEVSYRGKMFKTIDISIDIVPAIRLENWFPEGYCTALNIVPQQALNKGCFAVFRSMFSNHDMLHCQASLSYLVMESAIFGSVPCWMRQVFVLLKALRSPLVCPCLEEDGELVTMENFITSYMLKTSFFQVAEKYINKLDTLNGMSDFQKTMHLARESLIYLEQCILDNNLPSLFLPRLNVLLSIKTVVFYDHVTQDTLPEVKLVNNHNLSKTHNNEGEEKETGSILEHMIMCIDGHDTHNPTVNNAGQSDDNVGACFYDEDGVKNLIEEKEKEEDYNAKLSGSDKEAKLNDMGREELHLEQNNGGKQETFDNELQMSEEFIPNDHDHTASDSEDDSCGKQDFVPEDDDDTASYRDTWVSDNDEEEEGEQVHITDNGDMDQEEVETELDNKWKDILMVPVGDGEEQDDEEYYEYNEMMIDRYHQGLRTYCMQLAFIRLLKYMYFPKKE